MTEFKRHPLSALFAQYDLKGEDLSNLAEDIRKNGQLLPITLYQGEVLDGWNRYRACQAAGAEPVTMDLAPGMDPWEFVKASNMLRRHMAPAERVAVFLLKSRMNDYSNNHVVKIDQTSTREIEADLEVSHGTAVKAQRVMKADDPSLEQALSEKRVSLDRAAELAKLPKEERQAALEAPPAPKVKGAAPSQEPACTDPRAQELEAEVASLKEQLASRDAKIADLERKLAEAGEQVQELHEDLNAAKDVLDAEDLRARFEKEVAAVGARARQAETRLRAAQAHVRDAQHMAKMWKGKFEKLEKQQAKAKKAEMEEVAS